MKLNKRNQTIKCVCLLENKVLGSYYRFINIIVFERYEEVKLQRKERKCVVGLVG